MNPPHLEASRSLVYVRKCFEHHSVYVALPTIYLPAILHVEQQQRGTVPRPGAKYVTPLHPRGF